MSGSVQGCNATLNELYSNTGGDSDKVGSTLTLLFSVVFIF